MKFDRTFDFLKDPYRFISNEAREKKSDIFETRIFLRPVICMTGEECARLFYDPTLFTRKGALPGILKSTLFGKGGVQVHDGQEHLHRKRLFRTFLEENKVLQLKNIMEGYFRVYLNRWSEREQIVFYDEVKEILTRSVCEWAGIHLNESEVKLRTHDLGAMYEFAGSKSGEQIKAKLARDRCEKWIGELIEQVRNREMTPAEESALWAMASFRDGNGELLHTKTAAVELLSLLRPTVAVSVFITFCTHALQKDPEFRCRILDEGKMFLENFVNEVRRYYPFFPAVMARVKDDFESNGFQFKKGRKVFLDLYGTNHDPRYWQEPEAFNPDRFKQWSENPNTFIPQGGGDPIESHRCPGEALAVELMKTAIHFLIFKMEYQVPEQDLEIDFHQLPALPRSRFIMANPRWAPENHFRDDVLVYEI